MRFISLRITPAFEHHVGVFWGEAAGAKATDLLYGKGLRILWTLSILKFMFGRCAGKL